VVALLASYGIEVSEGLVSNVKVEGLKRSDDVKRRKAKLQQAERRSSLSSIFCPMPVPKGGWANFSDLIKMATWFPWSPFF
jgi:hypothetical protein